MKTVLITGANKGIGFETAKQLAQQDCFVYLGCRDRQRGRDALEQMHRSGIQNVDVLPLDVTDIDSIKISRRLLESKTEKLDVLINNAGIRGEIPQVPSRIPVEFIKEVFETNFFGMIQVTQQFMPLLEKAQLPVIVNVTSDLGSLAFRGDPGTKAYTLERSAYAPSKTAVNAYTVALAVELRDSKFRVNCVNPGHTATDFNNYAGTRSPDHAAKVIVKYAMLDENGPNGKCFDEDGEMPW